MDKIHLATISLTPAIYSLFTETMKTIETPICSGVFIIKNLFLMKNFILDQWQIIFTFYNFISAFSKQRKNTNRDKINLSIFLC